jgi:hypothetical protein
MVAKVDGELPSHLGLVVSYNIEKKRPYILLVPLVVRGKWLKSNNGGGV